MYDLLSPAEAAAVLNITPRTLLSWREQKLTDKPPFYRIGKNIRYSRQELREWILKQRETFTTNEEII